MDKSFIIGTTLVALVAVAIISGTVMQTATPVNTMTWTSAVCVYKNGEQVGPCEHNLVTNAGLTWVRDKIANLNGAAAGYARTIILGNGSQGDSNPAATTLSGQIGDCGLNSSANGEVVATAGGTANYSTTYQWTSTCNNVYVNATALYNNTTTTTTCAGGCMMFAVKNFTSGVNLSSGDQLNVTWYVWAVTG